MKAKNLRILILRDGDEKVNLTMPAISAKWIIDLMSDDILEKINNKGIDIVKIQDDLNKQEVLMAQNLFELISEEKTIKVWLE